MTRLKGEVGAEQAAKRPKVGIVGDAAKAATPRCTDPAMVLLEPTVLKQSVRPLALDPASTLFFWPVCSDKSIQPTIEGNVGVLKEHFSSYGDLSTVELEDLEALDGGNGSDASRNCSARIIFTTRRSAERAFVNESSPSASKGSSDADLQPAGKVACSVSLETVLSGNGEPEDSERKSSMEHKEPDGIFRQVRLCCVRNSHQRAMFVEDGIIVKFVQ
ncbi:hypothetical protein CK203_067359 [Vitis vinifera]|uniref:Uncharacterized protein n=1 Tax=Vitis vinifera TaxID=29760 RepID=A0A438EFK7_VITVI|nr:hypothetical protein CK203_067359 [Vitis vinifera]